MRITRRKSLKWVQSLTLDRGSNIAMAAEITQGGFDGQLERESGSRDCHPLCLRLSPPERGFSLARFVNQMGFHVLKNEYSYKMLFFSSLKIVLGS